MEDGEGKKRLRKVQKNERIYTLMEQLTSPPSGSTGWSRCRRTRGSTPFPDPWEKYTVLLQFNFSENPNIREQDKVQTTHCTALVTPHLQPLHCLRLD